MELAAQSARRDRGEYTGRALGLDIIQKACFNIGIMGFFWSGRNASIAGIFRRSARYWVTSWVGNCLWGPPGWRGPKNPNHPDHAEWVRQQAQREVDRMAAQSPAQKARRINRDTRELGARLRWSQEKIRISAAISLRQELGLPLWGAATVSGGTLVPRVAAKPRAAAEWKPFQAQPAGVSRSGGLRSGASLCGVARIKGGQPKRGAAVHSSGGLRGGAAKRWAR